MRTPDSACHTMPTDAALLSGSYFEDKLPIFETACIGRIRYKRPVDLQPERHKWHHDSLSGALSVMFRPADDHCWHHYWAGQTPAAPPHAAAPPFGTPSSSSSFTEYHASQHQPHPQTSHKLLIDQRRDNGGFSPKQRAHIATVLSRAAANRDHGPSTPRRVHPRPLRRPSLRRTTCPRRPPHYLLPPLLPLPRSPNPRMPRPHSPICR